MSHEIDMSNNRENIAYVGEAPWHKLGTQLPKSSSLEQWAAAAGLEWTAEICPLKADLPITCDDEGNIVQTEQIEVPGNRALIRSDTHKVLSVVSRGYKVVQPQDVLGFFKDLVTGLGGYQMETAGCLADGKKIWALAKCVENGTLELSNEDKVVQYLLLATSFDRSLPTIGSLTSTRVVCWNTLSLALKNRSQQFRITHNCKFDPDTLKLQLGVDAWANFAEDCKRFADKKVTEGESREYLAECLAASNPHREAKSYLEDKDTTMDLLVNLRDNAPGQDFDTAKGTLWGSLNSITYWTDHVIKSKSDGNRLDSSWFGRGNRVKKTAYEAALALI